VRQLFRLFSLATNDDAKIQPRHCGLRIPTQKNEKNFERCCASTTRPRSIAQNHLKNSQLPLFAFCCVAVLQFKIRYPKSQKQNFISNRYKEYFRVLAPIKTTATTATLQQDYVFLSFPDFG
jgi:hypothetical protein